MDVIDKFDFERGFRFTTYAAFWIKQAIQRALKKKARMIRIPIRKSRMIGRLNEQIANFKQDKGREPKPKELASALDISEKDVRNLLELRESVLSYDSAIGDDDSNRLLLYLADENVRSPFERCSYEQMKNKIDDVLGFLNEKERMVLRYRFGLENSDELSLRKISARMGLSQEGVRRIQNRALNKLRRPGVKSLIHGLV